MSVINTNLKSLQAQDALNINNRSLSKAMQRLTTGNRINSAADDAAGLGIATRMTSQVRGLSMAIKNANDAMSLTQTAEGAMDEVTNILQRMRELAVQSASDTNSAEDRTNMNMEVEQLSSEIDRIAGTTQFNNMNVLDGSFAGKVFQIGANANQTMGLSIGSMNSRVLGVAASTTTMASATPGTNPAGEVNGITAQGVAPEETVVKLEFHSSGIYNFGLKDSVTGLEMTTANMASMTVDLTSQLSKDYFVERINEALQDAQGDTTVTGSRVWTSTTTLDLTDTANLQKMKFSISVDGEQVDIDVTQALLGAHPASGTAIARDEAISAVEAALQLAFDDNLNVSAAATGYIKIEDAQGRRIEVMQGAGDGFIFGTDVENGGGLLARETARNPISVAWDGDSNNLIVSNSMGGKTSLTGFSSDTSGVMFNVINDSQVDGLFEPQWLSQSPAAVAPSMSAVTFNGNVEPTEISLRFSDLAGASVGATSAIYSFKLTNGKGDVYGTFSVNMSQNLTDREDTIASAMRAELTSAVAALATSGDSTFNADEFEITVAGDTIQIRNNSGRALAVEDFSSSAGYVVVTPLNEPASSEVLASRNAYYSENRIKVNAGAFNGVDFAGLGTSAFRVTVNGIQSSGYPTLSLSAGGDLASGTALASAIQTKILAQDVYALVGGAISATVKEVLSANVTVSWDEENSEIVIRDANGRSIGFGWAASAQGGLVFTQNFNVGNSNQGIATKLDSQIAQGDVYEATRVTMTFDSDVSGFNFKLNGTALDSSAGATVLWDATEPFEGSDLKTKLDAMMVKLNADHPRTVFEYSVSGRSITFLQRDGGPLEFGSYTTDDDTPYVKASLTPADGQGEATTLAYYGHNTTDDATAAGTLAVTTSATLNLEGDDIYSLTVSDGTKSYSLSSTVLDISDNDSVNNFLKKLENTLDGSSITASMDTNGNVYFSRADGGKLVLESFASATGRKGTWTPGDGQGDAIALSGSGAVSGTTVSGASPTQSGSAGATSVKQISIATQDGATKALSVIDKAISYVNTERSKLGAVVNRLTHTVDNLANIVTNTEASRSRIKDTDYASETAELARTQIIQQAATAMLAQANQAPQSVLALLR